MAKRAATKSEASAIYKGFPNAVRKVAQQCWKWKLAPLAVNADLAAIAPLGSTPMQIAIAGAHGQIAQTLTVMLTAREERVVGLIRNPDHAEDVQALGAEPVLCDLERESVEAVAHAITGCGAVVFAAGAGPGSGAERKLAVDRDGAVKLLQAAVLADVPRYLIVSAVGAGNPPAGDDVFEVYLRAKAQADAAVQDSDRDWTVVRPGRLTDNPGTGHVQLQESPFRGEIPREDVAAVLDQLLATRAPVQRVLYVNSGDQPIAKSLSAVLG